MAIRISRNSAGNCVNFIGTTNPAYFNACLSGSVDEIATSTVNVKNDIRSVTVGQDIFEFYQIPYTDFSDRDGNSFASAQECADYITQQCNVASNTGQFILSESDTLDFSLDPTGTTILLDNGDAHAVNSIRAVSNDSSKIDILQHTGSAIIFKDLVVSNATISTQALNAHLATAVNELNALFAQSGSASGDPPVITSSTTVNMTAGDTLNYELTADNGVAYEWGNLPVGVTTLDGNSRKLIGGSTLGSGTYNVTATAINYFGSDTETISIVVASPPFANTKSVNFNHLDYLGANASLLDGALGRSASGVGAGDAWTISFWFKASHSTYSQMIFYFGHSDVDNGGNISVRFLGGYNQDQLRLRYGTNYNYVQLKTAANTLPHNTWRHVVISYDGGTTGANTNDVSDYYSRFEIFIDGVQQTTTNTHSNYGYSGSVTGQNLRIGRYASGAYMRDNCRVEELAVWDSDESSNASLLYNGGSTHDLSQLASAPSHWWRMGDGDTYPNIQDNIGYAHFVMYNMTAADIITDSP